MIREKIVNNFEIKNIPIFRNKTKFKGDDILNSEFPNIFICAKKKSGKSVLIYNILEHLYDADTKIILYCSTIGKDPVYDKIIKKFDCEIHKSITDGKIDTLKTFMKSLNVDKEEEPIIKSNLISINSIEPEDEEEREKKYIIVYDDLSAELKHNNTIEDLVKKNRHLHIINIFSSQHILDLSVPVRLNIDLWLLFGSLPADRVETAFKCGDSSLDFEDFLQIYRYCTQDKYNFMYFDCRDDQYRKNFNVKLSFD